MLSSLASGAARAADWDLSLDLSAASSDGRKSYLDGGLGKLSTDSHDAALQFGRLRGALTQPLGEVVSLRVDASRWGSHDVNRIDLTEAYLEYRPYPWDGFRTRVRVGAFYPPGSLENRAAGWETPYTLSSSPINAWIAEEIRPVGLEGQVQWLGSRLGRDVDLELAAALFGWNDPAGTQIARHGFALDDRQTPLFGRVRSLDFGEVTAYEPFRRIDGRAGFYVGGQARYLDRLALSALHYDNQADPTAYSAALDVFAWQTRFDTAGVRLESGGGWTGIVEWLAGTTAIAPGSQRIEWAFRARSGLISRSLGPHMLTVRFDKFEVVHAPSSAPGSEDGHAWTLAYSFDRGLNWRFSLEWLRVTSDVSARPVLLGEPALATESKVQVAVRYALHGSFPTRSMSSGGAGSAATPPSFAQ